MASSFPGTIDGFRSKLNYKSGGTQITGETLNFVAYDATYSRAMLIHDNATGIVVKEAGVTKTLNTDYTIVADANKPWIQYIQRLTSIATAWTADYSTEGDENDADDINDLQDAITAVQTALGANLGNVLKSSGNQYLNGSLELSDGKFITTGAAGTLYRIGLHRAGLDALPGATGIPWTAGITIEADEMIAFIESDSDKISGWADVNNNNFRWNGEMNVDSFKIKGWSIQEDTTTGNLKFIYG